MVLVVGPGMAQEALDRQTACKGPFAIKTGKGVGVGSRGRYVCKGIPALWSWIEVIQDEAVGGSEKSFFLEIFGWKSGLWDLDYF